MQDIPINGWVEVWTRCTQCSGTGKVEEVACTECAGTGKKSESVSISRLTVHIEKHTRDNLDRDVRRATK